MADKPPKPWFYMPNKAGEEKTFIVLKEFLPLLSGSKCTLDVSFVLFVSFDLWAAQYGWYGRPPLIEAARREFASKMALVRALKFPVCKNKNGESLGRVRAIRLRDEVPSMLEYLMGTERILANYSLEAGKVRYQVADWVIERVQEQNRFIMLPVNLVYRLNGVKEEGVKDSSLARQIYFLTWQHKKPNALGPVFLSRKDLREAGIGAKSKTQVLTSIIKANARLTREGVELVRKLQWNGSAEGVEVQLNFIGRN